jgi:hypothetical protein
MQLNPGYILNDLNEPVYIGSDLAALGVGIYGQSPQGLTLTGYLKPGALELMVNDAAVAVVLNTPSSWTGQFGINSLIDYLNFPTLQHLTQIKIMEGSYQGLLDSGILTGDESSVVQATFLMPAVKYGVDAVVNWVNNTPDPVTLTKILQLARQGQYTINFVELYRDQLGVLPDLPGYTNTALRESLDAAVTDIIGNQKIPNIEYADIAVASDTSVGGINRAVGNVLIPRTTDEDGTFRFSPDAPRG